MPIFDAHETFWSVTLAIVAVCVIMVLHDVLGAILRTSVDFWTVMVFLAVVR
jgi:hypothetical protein